MQNIRSRVALCFIFSAALLIQGCATATSGHTQARSISYNPTVFESRLPSHIQANNEKVIMVSPRAHAWGAYNSAGSLVRGGIATAGADWCSDLGRRCHTRTGSYRIMSLGSASCKSSIFPLPSGGAPMPYCMFFNRGQALHGSPPGHVIDGNASHGCVRLEVSDAEWLRFNFATVGTKVVVTSY